MNKVYRLKLYLVENFMAVTLLFSTGPHVLKTVISWSKWHDVITLRTDIYAACVQ